MAIWDMDLKAPRFGKGVFTQHLLDYGLYMKWKAASGRKLPYKEWRAIAISLLERYILPIFDGDETELPQHLGEMAINFVTLKEGRVPTDIKKSRMVGRKVPFTAIATDGKIGKLVWKMGKAMKNNSRLMLVAFEPEQKYNAISASAIKERTADFKMARKTLNT